MGNMDCSLSRHFITKFSPKSGFHIIVFLTLIVLSNATCKSSLFKLYNDRYLPNHVMKTTEVTSQFECSMLCLRKDDFESWNFYQTSLGFNCELNNGTVTEEMVESSLLRRDGSVFARQISTTKIEKKNHENQNQRNVEMSYIFTNLGAEGVDGPASTAEYLNTSLEGQVTLQNGTQEWRVPQTGTYLIESLGASGANGTCLNSGSWQRGGLGAKMSGKFFLTKDTILRILVGQRGIMGTSFKDRPGGGGGGSFVTYANNTPLIIAGGGGGGGGCLVTVGKSDGDAGQQGALGSRCNSTASNGGLLCSNEDSFTVNAGSGAGLLGDGKGGNLPARAAKAFLHGGQGAWIHIESYGGFGGGGYGFFYGGGGGGYTGGGVWANKTTGVAGGGGSVNYGFDKQSGHGNPLEHGLVKFVFIG